MVQPLRLDHSYFHIQMKKVVVMVDGGFLRMILPKIKEQKNQYISPEQYSKFLIENIKSTIDEAKHEELFRILYYDCYPHRWEAPPNEPISKDKIASKKSEKFSMLFRYLGEQPGVALRMGRLAFRGLNLKKKIIEQIKSQSHQPQITLTLSDKIFYEDFVQKGVDIKIGLDIAHYSLNKLVDKIILITNDTDLIPAIKEARRNGVQVIIPVYDNTSNPEKNYKAHKSIIEHSDEIRKTTVKQFTEIEQNMSNS